MNFRLVPSPLLFPGKTLVHRTSGDTEPVVDTSVDLFGEYRVYLSRSEVNQAAILYGYVAPDVHAEIVAGLEAENARLSQQAEELRAMASVPLAEVIDFATEKARIELERAQAAETAPVA